MIAIIGPMGLFSGVAFALLLRARRGAMADVSLMRCADLGFLATAIVQVAYLGHGDAGLAANIKMAVLFSVIGGVIAMI